MRLPPFIHPVSSILAVQHEVTGAKSELTLGSEGDFGGIVCTLMDDDITLGACDFGLDGSLSFHAVDQACKPLLTKPSGKSHLVTCTSAYHALIMRRLVDWTSMEIAENGEIADGCAS